MNLATFDRSPQAAALGIGFRIAGALVGLPSLAFACFDGWNAYEMFEAPPGDSPADYDSGGGLITIITSTMEASESGLHILAGAAAWLFTALALFAGVLTFVGLFLYLTGGAIRRGTASGRVCGILLSLLVLAASGGLIALTVIDANVRVEVAYVSLVPCAASLYSLWVLVARYA